MKKIFKCTGITALTAIFLLGFCPMAWAEYEIDLDTVVPSVSIGIDAQTGPEEDLRVEWEKPTVDAGDQIIEYVYIWNNSETSLNDDDLNRSINDGVVSVGLESPFLTKEKSFFANDDYDVLWYLHIKTAYSSTPFIPPGNLSDDVVIGPFNFDNVAPTGTIALDTSVPGQTTTTSSVNPVTLTLAATGDTATVYLSNSEIRPVTGIAFANTIEFEVTEGAGEKTIRAWFEDGVGNLSTPVTLTFDLTAGKTMSPIGPVLLEVGATQTFTIQGAEAGETFNWAISVPNPENVASFVGASTGVASVEVRGDNEGTFKVQATAVAPSTGTYTSGTVTVVQTTLSKVFDLITTATTNTNTIGFIFENTGITTAHELGTAVGNCTQVAKWNAATQSYLSHRMQFPTLNNFALSVGEAYFVTITEAHQFTLTGKAPASHSQALITTATTNTNAIGVPDSKSGITKAHDLGLDIGNCSQVSKWNAPTQSYLSHRMQFPTLNNFDIEWGQGYFITVTQATDWPW